MERAYFWIGYFMITVVVFLTVLATMNKLSDNTSFEQKYFSKDISLLEQTGFIAPYDVSILYDLDEDYFVLFEDICSLRVNKKDTPLYSGGLTFCIADNYLQSTYPSERIYGTFEMKKNGDIFEVKDLE